MTLLLYLVIILAGVIPPTAIGYIGHLRSVKLSRETLAEAREIKEEAEKSASIAVNEAKSELILHVKGIENKIMDQMKDYRMSEEQVKAIVEELKPDLLEVIHGKLGAEVAAINDNIRNDDNIQAYLDQADKQGQGAGGLTERLLERVVDNFI